jgi:two-component system, NarL family, invasion response regulator UvrY
MTNAKNNKIKVIIADDHPVVREGIVHIISNTPDLIVVGEAENGVELLEKVRGLDLDVVVLDVDMPQKNGWEVMAHLNAEYPKLPIIILSGFPENDYAVQFFKAGASGYLNKLNSRKEIAEAIRKVAGGGKYINPNIAEKLAFDIDKNSEKKPHETLSTREFQIFFMIASGKSVKEISEELSLSVPTISSYRTRMLEKMALESNAQVIKYAFRHGLLK